MGRFLRIKICYDEHMLHPSKSFLWGASTSAHQVEGNNMHNDWWDWEQKTPTAAKSGKATDHYNRYKEDFNLVETLGHNAHRLSLEWSRIEHAPGKFNKNAIEHYRAVLEDLKRRNIQTFVTLHHFTNPLWLAREGGWLNGATPERFARYARYVAQHLGDVVDFWITINEPMVYATQSFWRAKWPPQHTSIKDTLSVIGKMAKAHRLSYRSIHSVLPHARVGISKHLIAYLPEDRFHIDDQVVTRFQDWWFNHRFFSLTGLATHDFIGVNYYFATKHHVTLFPPKMNDIEWTGSVSDMGWPIRPEGLTHVLLHMKRYGKPLYITENGIADATDSQRADFIRSHLRAVEKAQEGGADVRGYLYWSLLDNFEWADGFDPRFGLVEVDYNTLQRKIRPSGYVYKAIIEQAQGNPMQV